MVEVEVGTVGERGLQLKIANEMLNQNAKFYNGFTLTPEAGSQYYS